ncbi:hypothetical protein MSIMFI_05410 [Mycobacterium simulans]|uniref:hypothetical protein n=1 Tax=Mycobacterium simulans TaxID=627089 RepID=UPI00174B0820|nr:hypothetical protein [Mycobacterium simulans]SON63879.1 hypothetical protein MSIMFI_05410 [Mycobacterium simulans]
MTRYSESRGGVRIGESTDAARPGVMILTTGAQPSAKPHTTASGSAPDPVAIAVVA